MKLHTGGPIMACTSDVTGAVFLWTEPMAVKLADGVIGGASGIEARPDRRLGVAGRGPPDSGLRVETAGHGDDCSHDQHRTSTIHQAARGLPGLQVPIRVRWSRLRPIIGVEIEVAWCVARLPH